MKSTFNHLIMILIFGLSGLLNIQAQNNDDGYGGHWFLGLNGGGAWQQSDVRYQMNGGLGLYLGKNILYSPTGPLSFDLRFRYLHTTTQGQDWKRTDVSNIPALNGSFTGLPNYIDSISNNSTFLNHETKFNDLSLEGRINFENLRRKNRIWLSLYGGIGLGIYEVNYDQFDASGFEYFTLNNSINDLLGKEEIANLLVNGRDGTFETPMTGLKATNLKTTFTPNVGIELGYWVTRRFAIGVGHRVNWTFKDDFDGVIRGNGNNIHHYANFFLHFRVTDKKKEPIRNPDPNPVVVRPQVDIFDPAANPANVNVPTANIRATIRNVETSSGVMMFVNNALVSNYNFNPTTDQLDAVISLNTGNNTVRITGTNAAGTAEDMTTIIYQPSLPPTVVITNPGYEPFQTNVPTQTINATITNVNSPNNVTFTLNGQNISNFTLNGTNFSASNVPLMQGSNTVIISANNLAGNASDQTEIVYQTAPLTPPTVTITNPFNDPSNTRNPTETIRATITNVNNPGNVSFTVNGVMNTNFTLSGTNFVSNVVLNPGNNIVVINASNQDGQASDQTTIIYQAQTNPPSVVISNPSNDPATVSVPTTAINATVLNVSNPANVNFTVNGIVNNNFTLSGTNFTAPNVPLQTGSNIIRINVSNQDGQASDQTTLVYQVQANPPAVVINNPGNDPATVSVPTTLVNATVLNVSNPANVNFTVNGIVNNNFTLSGTNFTAPNVPLQNGSNIIRINVSNQDGQANDQTTVIYQPAENPPTVIITNPATDPSTVNAPIATINATVINVTSANNVTFTINGVQNNNFTLNGTSFTALNVPLQNGNNNINITVRNQSGQASDQTMIVCQPSVNQITLNPPTVLITNPSSDPLTTDNSSQNITATITNVSSAANIIFTINGIQNPNFRFSGNILTANNVGLQEGNNTVVISASNTSGTASDQTVIIYKTIKLPTVDITNPSVNPANVSVGTQVVNATITNVSSAANVKFTVNGVQNNNFTLVGTNFTAAAVSLQSGNNLVVITATNQDGTASDQTMITYFKGVLLPTVNITNPSTDPYVSNVPTQNINATITNVSDPSGITFNVNGVNNSTFSFSGTSFIANGINLNPGRNTISITARNQDGTASDMTMIRYEQILPPTVNITNPSSETSSSSAAAQNIAATITNISNPSQITFTINNVRNTNFTLTGASFNANNVVLQPGANIVVIGASNEAGNANDQAVINVRIPNPPTVVITKPTLENSPVNSAITSIEAVITNISDVNNVNFTVNGQTVRNFTLNGSSFVANNVVLNPGSNQVVISATNQDGTASDRAVLNLQSQNSITPPPTVVITNPETETFEVSVPSVNVSADITNVTNIRGIRFTVNGQPNNNFTFEAGRFSAIGFNINPGNNVVVVTATNQSGTASDQAFFIYNAGPQPPVVTITQPTANPFVTSSNTATIRATILNVNSPSNVAFQVNGAYVTNFSFNGTSFEANNVRLNQGLNNFTIFGNNSVGTDSKSAVIDYKFTPPPSITDMSVSTQPENNQCRVIVYAGLNNVSNIRDIVFKINNAVISSGYTFQNGIFQYSYLVPPSNSVINYSITVSNGSGTVTDSKTGNIGGCVSLPNPPDVKNTNVSIVQQGPSCIANVSSTVLNVTGREQITFTANGKPNNNFNFANGVFTASVDVTGISARSISFVVSAANSGGNDSETATGSLSSCVSRPVITNMQASQQQVRGSFFATVTANISGVQNNAQIVFKVNGTPNTNFTFANGQFNATNIAVNPGNNSFEIIATNAAGTASDNKAMSVSGNTGGSQNGNNNSTNTLNGNPVDNNNGNNNNGNNGNNGNGNNGNNGNEKGGKLNPVKPADNGGLKGGKLEKGGGN